jgi:hypothetical protein
MTTTLHGKAKENRQFLCLSDIMKLLLELPTVEIAEQIMADMLLDNLRQLADCKLGVSKFNDKDEITVDYELLRTLLPMMPNNDTPEFRRRAMGVLAWLLHGKATPVDETDEYYPSMQTTCSRCHV